MGTGYVGPTFESLQGLYGIDRDPLVEKVSSYLQVAGGEHIAVFPGLFMAPQITSLELSEYH